jgi:hypothetical protein
MILTRLQTQTLLQVIQKWQAIFIGNQIGVNFLSPADRLILQAAGIDLSKFTVNGIISQAFNFGILAQALGDKRAAAMSFIDFKKFIDSGKFAPLNQAEEFALDLIKNRAFNDISGMGNKISSNVSNMIVRASSQRRARMEKILRDKTLQAIENREGAQWLASEMGHATGDWARDFDRIADYLLHEAYDNGRAQSILREFGTDAEVFKDVYGGACKHCKSLYLESPDDPDSPPLVFKITELISNGNNIGVKTADWKPVIGPTHPYCRCTLNHKRVGYKWNAETRNFDIPSKYKPTNKKLKNVKLDIGITVGGKKV